MYKLLALALLVAAATCIYIPSHHRDNMKKFSEEWKNKVSPYVKNLLTDEAKAELRQKVNEWIQLAKEKHGQFKSHAKNFNFLEVSDIKNVAKGFIGTFFKGAKVMNLSPMVLAALGQIVNFKANKWSNEASWLEYIAVKALLASNCLRDGGAVLLILDTVIQDPTDIINDIFAAIFIVMLGNQALQECKQFINY